MAPPPSLLFEIPSESPSSHLPATFGPQSAAENAAPAQEQKIGNPVAMWTSCGQTAYEQYVLGGL